MKKVLIIILTLFTTNVFAQNVGIGTTTPDASAMLEINAANRG